MTHPHPSDDDFADAYSRAWTSEPDRLIDFFAFDGYYIDVAMGATYRGRDQIARFHHWMLKFAPDSAIEFSDACAADGRLYLQWIWSGTFEGALRLPRWLVSGIDRSVLQRPWCRRVPVRGQWRAFEP